MEEQKTEKLPEEFQAENSTEEDNGEQEKASGRRMLLCHFFIRSQNHLKLVCPEQDPCSVSLSDSLNCSL